MGLIGFASVPRRVSETLTSAAASSAAAASELYVLSRGAGEIDGVVQAASETRQSAKDAGLAASHMVATGLDREDVLAIALSLRLVADRLEEAAHALQRAGRDVAHLEALAGVERDLAREVAAVVRQFDGPRDTADARFIRVESLRLEGRRLLRSARSRLLTSEDDLAIVLAGQDALRRMERAMLASRRSARVVQRVLLKYR